MWLNVPAASKFSWSFRRNDKIENHVLIDVRNTILQFVMACKSNRFWNMKISVLINRTKTVFFFNKLLFLLLSVNHDYMEMLMIRGIGVNIVRQKVGLGNLFWFWLWQIVCCHFSDKLANWSFQAATVAAITTTQLLQNMSQTLNHRKRSA